MSAEAGLTETLRERQAQLYERLARAAERIAELEVELERARRPGRAEVPGRERALVADAAADADAAVALRGRLRRAEGEDVPTAGPVVPVVPLPDGSIARPGLRLACVMDEFSRLAFGYEFDLIDLRPVTWRPLLERRPPDALLVESAWRGTDDAWRFRISRSGPAHPDLVELVEWCRARGVPTVFWNKEDPANFDRFGESAALFDHVFTTDGDCIPRYRQLLGHDRVHVLPFAAQPRIHNPVRAEGGRRRPVAFAGSYFAEKYPERRAQMDAVLGPAREFGLEIFARVVGDPRYEFPPEYHDRVVGTLPYPAMLTAYKLYKVFLNVNSVPGSPTMCARRIFELLACGTAVVSGRSPAIEAVLGEGLVAESDDPERTRRLLEGLLGDDDARARAAVRGLRTVLRGHTYADRVQTICDVVGLDAAAPAAPAVTVVALAADAAATRTVAETAAAQTVRPAEILFGELHSGETAGAALRRLVAAAETRFVAVLDPAAAYGPTYLEDALNAFRYTKAAIVGKRARHVADAGGVRLVDLEREYAHVGWVDEATVTLDREALGGIVPRDLDEGALALWQVDCTRAGRPIFATDRFNCVTAPGGTRPSDTEARRAYA